jgi:hypothetical protein
MVRGTNPPFHDVALRCTSQNDARNLLFIKNNFYRKERFDARLPAQALT